MATQKLILPINKTRVTAGFKNTNYLNQFGFRHYGMDLTETGSNRTIWGSGNGQVLETGFDNVLGNVVIIRYDQCQLKNGTIKNLIQRLFHLDRVDVTKGQSITKDTRIGLYGSTGQYATGPHLHVEFDTDVNYPTYSPTLGKNSNIIKAGTDSVLNPADVMFVKKSAPDNQSVVGASNSDCWTNSDLAFPTYSGTTSSGNGSSYFPIPNYSGGSFVDALNSIGVNSSFDSREQIANANGISNYTGSADQNDTLLSLLMKGQLRQPGSSGGSAGSSYFPIPNYSGGSFVDALNSIGVNSSFDSREQIANANGISNYTGSADQNDTLLSLLMKGQLRQPGSSGGSAGSSYFPIPNYSGGSFVDALNSIGVNSSFDSREQIANANGISNYTGSADQNDTLLSLLMKGQLRQPGSSGSSSGGSAGGNGASDIGPVNGLSVRKNLVSSQKYSIKAPYPMDPVYITVHNTYNDASAENEIAYMIRNDNEVSFHFAVDDKEAVQGLPLNRNGWHAGDGSEGTGNRKSIAIEICYSESGGDRFLKAEKNAAKLIAALMRYFNIPLSNVRTHQSWSGKYCPHRTLDLGWNRFVKIIEKELTVNEDHNELVFKQMTDLCKLAQQYIATHYPNIMDTNPLKLALQYYRHSQYNGTAWTAVAGPLDQGYVNYVTTKYQGDIISYIIDPVSNEVINLPHLCVTLETPVFLWGSEFFQIADYAGWAGDLVSLIKNIKNKIGESSDVNQIAKATHSLIGNEDTYFSMEDYYSDIDAVNMYKLYQSKNYNNLGELFRDYYKNYVQLRTTKFMKNRFNGATSLEGIERQVCEVMRNYLWVEAIAHIVGIPSISESELKGLAKGFALKVIELYLIENKKTS